MEAPLLGKDSPPPHPQTHLQPGPWELTHCDWGRCGPSQTPSTANPSENPALWLAGTQRPRCLWRGIVLGSTRAQFPSSSLGAPSQTVLVLGLHLVLPYGCAGSALYHLGGHHSHRGQYVNFSVHGILWVGQRTPRTRPHLKRDGGLREERGLRKNGIPSGPLYPTSPNEDPFWIFRRVFGSSWGIVYKSV